MILSEALRGVRAAILADWLDRTLGIYPPESARFLRRTRDPFANPIGTTLASELEALLDGLLDHAPPDRLVPHLDRIVQVTCIQDVPPSTAVGFVFELKQAVRSILPAGHREGLELEQLRHFEQRVDELALLCFDSYGRLRQRIAQIREREMKTKVSALLRMTRANWDDLPTCEQVGEGCDQCESRSP